MTRNSEAAGAFHCHSCDSFTGDCHSCDSGYNATVTTNFVCTCVAPEVHTGTHRYTQRTLICNRPEPIMFLRIKNINYEQNYHEVHTTSKPSIYRHLPGLAFLKIGQNHAKYSIAEISCSIFQSVSAAPNLACYLLYNQYGNLEMEKLLTIDELFSLGYIPGICRRTVCDGLRAGWIRGYKIGKRWLVIADEVIADIKATCFPTDRDRRG